MNLPYKLPSKIHIIGATGRSGQALIKALSPYPVEIIALVRTPEKWLKSNHNQAYRLIDLKKPETLRSALHNATHIVNTAHARYAPIILETGPVDATYIFLGSTRKFTKWPDSHGNGVIAGEKALLESKRKGIILHPTMIYGSEGENNVQRLATLLEKLPIIPLPNGGKSLVQPIHQSDVTRAILAALSIEWTGPHSLIIAGKEALSYREFIRLILEAAQIKAKPILPIPVSVLKTAALFTRFIPIIPTIEPEEIQRLTEDKDFKIEEMEKILGFNPIDFSTGIHKTQFK